MSMLDTINSVVGLVMTEAQSLLNSQAVVEALDDGLDTILSALISSKFNVTVECNPEGNRNAICIDDENDLTVLYNVKLGRKASASELIR